MHPTDRAAIEATEAQRSLILDLRERANDRDLFNACARLGTLLAELGASPSLAAGTIDAVIQNDSRLIPARAALIEGYVSAIRDADEARAMTAWQAPFVEVGEGTFAVVCIPSDDAEIVGQWAEGVARKLTKAKAKRVIASESPARTELASALKLIGIELGPAPVKKKSFWPF